VVVTKPVLSRIKLEKNLPGSSQLTPITNSGLILFYSALKYSNYRILNLRIRNDYDGVKGSQGPLIFHIPEDEDQKDLKEFENQITNVAWEQWGRLQVYTT